MFSAGPKGSREPAAWSDDLGHRCKAFPENALRRQSEGCHRIGDFARVVRRLWPVTLPPEATEVPIVLAVTVFSAIRLQLGAPIASLFHHEAVAIVIAADRFMFEGAKPIREEETHVAGK